MFAERSARVIIADIEQAAVDRVAARPGVDRSAVCVVVTHAHYDHIGNVSRVPAAEIVMSRRVQVLPRMLARTS